MCQYDASDLNCELVQCAVCDKLIQDRNWFERIEFGERTLALCCPLCLNAFENYPSPYIKRIEKLEEYHSVGDFVGSKTLCETTSK